MQRKIETEIRKQKDTQILAKLSGADFKDLVDKSQKNITLLNKKYNNLCYASGLKPKKQRMQVLGYKRIDINKI